MAQGFVEASRRTFRDVSRSRCGLRDDAVSYLTLTDGERVNLLPPLVCPGPPSGPGNRTPKRRDPRRGGDLLRALGGNRTPNLLIRSQMLYPIELRALVGTARS